MSKEVLNLSMLDLGTWTRIARVLRFSKLDDDLDIVILPLESAWEVLWPLSSSDQPVQPRTVCLSQGFACLIPVPFVGVDAADNYVIL
jgi:hypothetical protein